MVVEILGLRNYIQIQIICESIPITETGSRTKVFE